MIRPNKNTAIGHVERSLFTLRDPAPLRTEKELREMYKMYV